MFPGAMVNLHHAVPLDPVVRALALSRLEVKLAIFALTATTSMCPKSAEMSIATVMTTALIVSCAEVMQRAPLTRYA